MISFVFVVQKLDTERGTAHLILVSWRSLIWLTLHISIRKNYIFFHHKLEYLILHVTLIFNIMWNCLEDINKLLWKNGIPCWRYDYCCYWYSWCFWLPNSLYLNNRCSVLIIIGTCNNYKFLKNFDLLIF